MHSRISDDVLINACEEYQLVRPDFTEHRKVISEANLWKALYQFYMHSLLPLDPSPERVLLWMMQSGKLSCLLLFDVSAVLPCDSPPTPICR